MKLSAMLFVCAGAALAGPLATSPRIYATGSEIIATLEGRTDFYPSYVVVEDGWGLNILPGNVAFFATGTELNTIILPGDVVDLGTAPRGDALYAAIHNTVTSGNVFTGPGGDNPDGFVHANTIQIGPDIVWIGWDVTVGPHDNWTYQDLTMTLTGVTTSPIPEPATFLLLGTGLLAVGVMRRR